MSSSQGAELPEFEMCSMELGQDNGGYVNRFISTSTKKPFGYGYGKLGVWGMWFGLIRNGRGFSYDPGI